MIVVLGKLYISNELVAAASSLRPTDTDYVYLIQPGTLVLPIGTSVDGGYTCLASCPDGMSESVLCYFGARTLSTYFEEIN